MTDSTGPRPRRIAVTATLMALLLAACRATLDPTWERVEQTGTVRVGMDPSFPPFSAVDADGTLVGFDVDLAREISERLGLDVHFVANLPYDGLYDALRAGRVDIVISALVVNPHRTEDYAYSRVYFDAGPVLVRRAGRDGVDAMADLDGRRLAVVLGTAGDLEGRRWARRLADLRVVPHQTAAEALRAVAEGEADVALVDHVSALRSVGQSRGLVIVSDPVVEVPYACAMRRDSPRLRRAVNEALQGMEEDGALERLISRWITKERPESAS